MTINKRLLRALCHVETHGVGIYDGRSAAWQPCPTCPGRLGKEERNVLHSDPPCSDFLRVIEEHGLKLLDFKDSSRN